MGNDNCSEKDLNTLQGWATTQSLVRCAGQCRVMLKKHQSVARHKVSILHYTFHTETSFLSSSSQESGRSTKRNSKKNLTYFEVPPASTEPIHTKLYMKIFDEYTNILKGMYSIRCNGRSDHGGTSTRPPHGRSDHGDTPV